MSLDNFGVKVKKKAGSKKSSTKPKKKEKKTTPKKKSSKKEEVKKDLPSENPRKKYYLKCTARCGYKRTIRKKELREEDYMCQKCGKKMKVYKTYIS